jgi:formylglycine-generating enzyme required for sulfatase activity
VYKAVLTLSATSGYTFAGVTANSFNYSGATSTNTANSGTVTITFPVTATTVNALNLTSYVTAPATGATPVTTAINVTQYTGTISWLPAHATFAGGTTYTATVTLTAKTGYTFTGVTANNFTYTGATVTNAANSGTVTITFPATATLPTLPGYTFITVPGATVNVSIGDTGGPFKTATTTPVTVAPFQIGETEATYELWNTVKTWAASNGYTFANPGRQGGDSGSLPVGTIQHPVTTISWRDAVVWCNAYSEASGKTPVYRTTADAIIRNSSLTVESLVDTSKIAGKNGYRLPTEAEWEFAARGGVPSGTTPWTYIYAGDDNPLLVAVYSVNSSYHTAAVKTQNPNTLGLYDMSGNVWEWCWDLYSGINRAARGGNWNDNYTPCRVDTRGNSAPTYAHETGGFRVVCTP